MLIMHAAIASADKLFAAKKYEDAIADYRKALVLKPSEKYPSDKIAEAEKLIADLKTLQESYDKAIADGDKYLSEKNFANSLASFKTANSYKTRRSLSETENHRNTGYS